MLVVRFDKSNFRCHVERIKRFMGRLRCDLLLGPINFRV